MLQGKGDALLPLALLGLGMFLSSGWPAILRNQIWSLTNLNNVTSGSTSAPAQTQYNPGTATVTNPRPTSIGNQKLD